MDEITIRNFSKEDLNNFVNLWNQEIDLLTTSKRIMTHKLALDGFNVNMFDYLGLYKNNKLIGFCLLRNDRDKVWVKHFMVNKDQRGIGFGEKLIQEAIKRTTDKDLLAEVLKENQKALKFFQNNRFGIIKEHDDEYILQLGK